MKEMPSEALKEMRFPVSPAEILRKRRSLRKGLIDQPNLLPVRIAILGGSTTTEVRSILELFLLDHGLRPAFYESGYNRYSEDIQFQNQELVQFEPDIVFLHTTWQNVSQFPQLLENDERVEQRVKEEAARFEALWEGIHAKFGAIIIQNNFDLPRLRPLGNLEASESYSRVNFLMRLNAEMAAYARQHPNFLINDIHYLSAQVGLDVWYGPTYWYSFHMAVSPAATVTLAQNVAAIIKSVYGKTKKCLVLDLDNTLWGGVIGDDGMQNLLLGKDHSVGEAFLDFQKYVKDLKRRGVILAVCSKNDPANAREGFSHPDSVLALDDFSAFKANWDPKPENIRAIASELNVGLDSIVFVDDNPAERALVAGQLPEVATPDVGSDVARYAQVLEAEHYFDVHAIVKDDLSRSHYYKANQERDSYQSSFNDYGEFLTSLEMTAEIAPFSSLYLERITQLINKTNQFNLTTRRYTAAEVEAIAQDSSCVTLYGRLIDRFGDNGLVSVVIGHVNQDALEIDLWLMSCRVLNREMELAMFDVLTEACQARGIRKMIGRYIPSKKNSMVAGHYAGLGFKRDQRSTEDMQLWTSDVREGESPKSKHIRRPAKSMDGSGKGSPEHAVIAAHASS
jgi:FkbH-like protein